MTNVNLLDHEEEGEGISTGRECRAKLPSSRLQGSRAEGMHQSRRGENDTDASPASETHQTPLNKLHSVETDVTKRTHEEMSYTDSLEFSKNLLFVSNLSERKLQPQMSL